MLHEQTEPSSFMWKQLLTANQYVVVNSNPESSILCVYTCMYVCIYKTYNSECDMAKYFISRLIYFQEPEASEIKPESEISCHNTLTSVISGLFHTRYSHYCS